jgi:hypothetical protein
MKNICISLCLVVALLIGGTIFITHKFDGVITEMSKFADRIDQATSKFDAVLDVFTNENVNGITRSVVNPDNIINVSDYQFASGTDTKHITVTYDDYGVLTLDGKASDKVSLCLGEFYVLSEGYYTITIEADAPARTTTKIRLVTTDSEGKESTLVATNFATPLTFKSESLQYVKVYIDIVYGDEFNNYTVAPVIVPGTNMGTYFIDETVKF